VNCRNGEGVFVVQVQALLVCVFLLGLFALAPIVAAQPVDPSSVSSSAEKSASTEGQSSSSADTTLSYAVLADLLADEKSRNALITQLRQLADEQPGNKPGADQANAKTQDDGAAQADSDSSGASTEAEAQSMEGAAGSLQTFAADMANDFSQTAAMLRGLFAGEGIHEMSAAQWKSRWLSLVLVIVSTLVAFAVFRLAALSFYRRLDAWVERNQTSKPNKRSAQLMPRVGAAAGALAIDAVTILLAALAGYGLSLFIQEKWQIPSLLGLLFVSAFVAIELARSLCRVVFAERHPHLRLWRMSDTQAQYWSGWLQRVISITGYGMLVAVPVVQQMLTQSMGRIVGLFIMLGVYVYAVRVIWRNRHDVRARIEQCAETASNAFFATLYRIAGRLWHWVGLAYFTALLVATQADQQNALPFITEATLRTLVVAGVATLIAAILSSLLARKVRLSDDIRKRLPLLESRLNSYVPGAIRLLRGVILVIAVLLILDAWRAFSLSEWLYSPQGRAAIAGIVHVAVILLFAMGIWTVVASIIESKLNDDPSTGTTERQKTLLLLFRSAALAVIVTMTVLIVLSQIGVDIGPLIAGAGVIGLAVGFGAQKLVQDIITGVFIQLENGMNHNDVVEVAGIFGTVEKITVRTVGIRTLDGGYHLIPFSAIDRVSNHMRDFGYHYGEYIIAYGADVDEAIGLLYEAFDELMQDPELAGMVLDKIDIPGVTSLHERGYNIRVLIKTIPGMQWAVQRGFNRLVRKRFADAGIDLPYPQTVLHFGKPQPGDIDPHILGGRLQGEQPGAAAPKAFNPQTQGPAPSGPDVGGGPDH
jgi:small-conductance mechanosensitive channel